MKNILIIAAIVMVSAACSSFRSAETTEGRQSATTIVLNRAVSSLSAAQKVSINGKTKQIHGQADEKIDRRIIYRAQKQLEQLGYNPGPTDGIWGPKTQQAVKRFQQDHRLPASGNLDQSTSRQLMQIADQGSLNPAESIDHRKTYSLMTAEDARQLIEKHINAGDIKLDSGIRFRQRLYKTDAVSSGDAFQGVRFDDGNYIVFALCEPSYMMLNPPRDLPDKLNQFNIDLPDEDLQFTYNGVFYSTVKLDIESNPVFIFTEAGEYLNDDKILPGGYQWLIGEYGTKLGNTFIFFQKPLEKNLVDSWRDRPDEYIIKLSAAEENSVRLDFFRP